MKPILCVAHRTRLKQILTKLRRWNTVGIVNNDLIRGWCCTRYHQLVPNGRWPGVFANNMINGDYVLHMMTSSNGNMFRVTGPLCGEFTGPGEFPAQRPVTRIFDTFFDLRLNKRLSKQSWGWWFETQSWSLWRQCNEMNHITHYTFHFNVNNQYIIERGIGVVNWLSSLLLWDRLIIGRRPMVMGLYVRIWQLVKLSLTCTPCDTVYVRLGIVYMVDVDCSVDV